MKNETNNFILICISYFAIGSIFAGDYIRDKTLKSIQSSIHTLIKIEQITEQQFNLLYDKVQELENRDSRRITHIGE